MFLGSQFNYWGSLTMALGYIGLVMLAVRRGWLSALQARLAAAGRMAFTNYIAQTLICTTIFYGHGFGLFGHVDRWQQGHRRHRCVGHSTLVVAVADETFPVRSVRMELASIDLLADLRIQLSGVQTADSIHCSF